MLQQTQVNTVIPYYHRFMERFPTLVALSLADESEVLKYWEGLGYYRRARQLLKLAKTLVADFSAVLPKERKTLLTLPGVGEYTAGALLAFVYDLPEAAVDGNVLRVIARLDARPLLQADTKSQREARERVRELMPEQRAGDFMEAMIELGATCCLSVTPLCEQCPLSPYCKSFKRDLVAEFPLTKKREKSPVTKLSYVLVHDGKHVFCRRRPEGLLEGLYEFIALPEKYKEHEAAKLEQAIVRMRLPFSFSAFRKLSYIDDKRVVFSHRIWDVSCWELLITPALWQTIADEPVEQDKLCLVDREGLQRLAFPAFLALWRDDFLSREDG